jgi:hypothetical protein
VTRQKWPELGENSLLGTGADCRDQCERLAYHLLQLAKQRGRVPSNKASPSRRDQGFSSDAWLQSLPAGPAAGSDRVLTESSCLLVQRGMGWWSRGIVDVVRDS